MNAVQGAGLFGFFFSLLLNSSWPKIPWWSLGRFSMLRSALLIWPLIMKALRQRNTKCSTVFRLVPELKKITVVRPAVFNALIALFKGFWLLYDCVSEGALSALWLVQQSCCCSSNSWLCYLLGCDKWLNICSVLSSRAQICSLV